MVEVTTLNGQKLVINGDLIERIEAKPDTIVSLSSGRKLIVRESVRDMVKLLTDYRRALLEGCRTFPIDNILPSDRIPIPEAV